MKQKILVFFLITIALQYALYAGPLVFTEMKIPVSDGGKITWAKFIDDYHVIACQSFQSIYTLFVSSNLGEIWEVSDTTWQPWGDSDVFTRDGIIYCTPVQTYQKNGDTTIRIDGLFKSTDKGHTWELLFQFIVKTPNYCSAFVSKNGDIYTSVNGQDIFVSTDGGSTFNKSLSFGFGYWMKRTFAEDPLNGYVYITDQYEVNYTSNRGKDWTALPDKNILPKKKYSTLNFYKNGSLYTSGLEGNKSKIKKYSPYDSLWSIVKDTLSGINLRYMKDSHMFCIVNFDTLLYSPDLGNTWLDITVPKAGENDVVQEFDMNNKGDIIATFGDSKLLKTVLETKADDYDDELTQYNHYILPNPASDYITIKNIGYTDNTKTRIYSLTGELFIEVKSDGPICVAALSPGVYIIRHGARTLKFVKE